MQAKGSENPAQKDDTQNGCGTSSTDPFRALTSRGTWCRGGVGSGVDSRRFDDNDSNVGGVGAGCLSESGSCPAESDIGTLESMSTPPTPPKSPHLDPSPAFPTDDIAGKEWKGKDETHEDAIG